MLAAATWLESCGAMTIEPTMADEPAVRPPPQAPRLMRRDGGGDAAQNIESEQQ